MIRNDRDPARPDRSALSCVRLSGVIIAVVCAVGVFRPGGVAAAGSDRALARHESPSIDPTSIERYGRGYRYPQAGWIVVHIEGAPYERGFQHGRLLAPEIADYVRVLAAKRAPKEPGAAWRQERTLVNALFLRRYDKEYLDEMKGIADGAASGGATFEGRPLDLVDIVAVNSEIEVDFLDGALAATSNGLESRVFNAPTDTGPPPEHPEHCSAFAATGPATADGDIVFGHITMFNLAMVRFFNVWLDVKPADGHRVLMQTYPGGIQSGLDYYMNDTGMLVAETTIAQTKFNDQGLALASRIRKALQYSSSIDEAVATLKSQNNGMYTNEWLLGDTKTNEIAMFELGTDKTKLWRSSKDEWFGGTKGFYWGCNNAKDLTVRLETIPSLEGRPANMVWKPSDRDQAWLKLFERHKGKIGAEFGFEAFTTPPLAAFPSCDAKFTTSSLSKELKTWALFGPPMGKTWEPTQAERDRLPSIKPLVANDWTLLSAATPSSMKAFDRLAQVEKKARVEVADKPDPAVQAAERELESARIRMRRLESMVRDVNDPAVEQAKLNIKTLETRVREARRASTPATDVSKPPLAIDLGSSKRPASAFSHGEPAPVWHGTILPKSDADVWLAAAFADYEHIVAHEFALKLKSAGGKLDRDARRQVALAMFAPWSRYRTGVARLGRDVPLSKTSASTTNDEWYEIAAGKGVLLLEALRDQMSHTAFLKLMDDFGRKHAGREVTTAMFRAAAEEVRGSSLHAFFDAWLDETGLPKPRSSGYWSIDSFEQELDRALIVYGTTEDAVPQREAAERLRRAIARRWSNIELPIKPDKEVTSEEAAGRHLLIVGRPSSNLIAAKLAGSLPLKFGAGSFTVDGDTYAHPGSAVVAAGSNGGGGRYSFVIFAGLSADSTWRCIEALGERGELGGRGATSCEILVLPHGGTPSPMVAPAAEPTKSVSR